MTESIIDVIELDNGDQIAVTIEWSPEPEQIKQIMLKAANDFEDWSIPLEDARQLMIANTEEHFATETDPQGVKWAPLDSDYLKWKQKSGAPYDDILVLSGDTKAAATSEENWIETPNSVFFNTASLPKYAPIHQEGTAPGASELRDIISALRTEGGTLTETQARRIAGKSIEGEGRGNNIPKRAFLGIDIATIDEIEQVFVAWMDNTVTDYVDWVAPVPIEGSNILGTFPIVGFTKRGQPLLRTPGGNRFGRFLP